MSGPDVWIPEHTAPQHRALLPAAITLHDFPQHGDLPERMGPGEVLVTGFFPQRPVEVMQRLDGLRFVQSLTAGVDLIAPHLPPGVALCDGSGIHDIPVAEWVVMAILAMRRNLPEAITSQRDATWRLIGGDDLEDATVLIVGHGSIGEAVAQRLRPFGARVVSVARRARDGVHASGDLPALLPNADVVVMLVPLTVDTERMVDAAFLEAMRPGALLLNAARGPVVDTDALLAALQSGHIRAALDVTDPEPLPDGHPLWTASGVLITPHTAGAVRRVFERGWRFAAEQLQRYLDGAPLRNVVVHGY